MREQLHAVHLGKPQVGENEVGAVDEAQALFAGRGKVKVIAGARELKLNHPAKLVFVLNDEHAFFGHEI